MTWDLQTSKISILTSKFDILRLNGFHDVFVFFLMIKRSSDKVKVTVNKFGVHSQHVIRCFLLHYAVFCLANVNINTLPAYFYGTWKVSFFQESMFWCLYVYLIPYIHKRPKPDGSKWRLSFIHYHCVSCHSCSVFDAIFDSITNMIGRLFNLHNVKSTPNNQTWKRRGFFIFILTLTSHYTFSYVFIL